MSARSVHLNQTAEKQISELIDLLATRGDAALQRPCPGREKLGDGTVAASAMHMADNYVRIAGFLDTDPGSTAAELGGSRHRIPRFARAAGHRIGPGDGGHPADYAAEDVGPTRLLDRVSIGRAALRRVADLTDEQLDAVPPQRNEVLRREANPRRDPHQPAQAPTTSTRSRQDRTDVGR